jgi:hypothetical protein
MDLTASFANTFTDNGILEFTPTHGGTHEFEDHVEVFSQNWCRFLLDNPPTEIPEFQLVVSSIQQYGTFPPAKTVYGSLMNQQHAGVNFMPISPLEELPADFVNKFIILYGSVYKVTNLEIYGFIAFSFNEEGEIRQFFVPMNAHLNSTCYAMCIK